jgi:hypothetical protein
MWRKKSVSAVMVSARFEGGGGDKLRDELSLL